MTASLTTSPIQSKRSTPFKNGVDVHSLTIPPYRPIRFLQGRFLRGHGHTLISARAADEFPPPPTMHRITLADGESVVLHENGPDPVQPGGVRGSVLLIHGLCGCHSAPYMGRFAVRLLRLGFRTFRMDMRGCGAALEGCGSITHAARSDDCVAALDFLAAKNDGPIGVVGVSLGGNQLLRAAGRIGAGLDTRPNYWERVSAILAVAPPIDLQACSDQLERRGLRFYNRYFIRRLLKRIPPRLLEQDKFQSAIAMGIPKTLRQFDKRFTAPLGGFADERDYYNQASAMHWIDSIDRSTLIVAAQDDPLIPVSIFQQNQSRLSESTRLIVQPTGGHVGFLQRRRTVWTDELVAAYMDQMR